MNILVLNVGSSSLKGRLYGLAGPIPSDPVEPLWDLQADWRVGMARPEYDSAPDREHS
jgi:hypothetical protein